MNFTPPFGNTICHFRFVINLYYLDGDLFFLASRVLSCPSFLSAIFSFLSLSLLLLESMSFCCCWKIHLFSIFPGSRENFELTFDSACSEILRSFFKMFCVEGDSVALLLKELLVDACKVAFEVEALVREELKIGFLHKKVRRISIASPIFWVYVAV